MWQSHWSQRAAGVCSRSKVAGGLRVPGGGGWQGAEARPPLCPGPQERSVSPPRSLYIFISQNEDRFPFLERTEWQIPYSDAFSNHPGGFVAQTK